MKITFKKIQLKNFLSFGNNITELNLNSNPFTLILGENGSGKSSIIVDALHFALFGKIIRRGVKQEQVVNNVNKSNCWVKLEFQVNGRDMVIERGLEPAILNFFKDGKKENERSSKKLVQQDIEAMLQFDQNTFKSLSVLSLNNSKAFVDLTPEETRNVIENLLGIQVYSLMLDEAKKILKELKSKIEILTKDYELYKELVSENENKLATAKRMKDEFEKNKQIKVNNIENEIGELHKKMDYRKGSLESIPKEKAPTEPDFTERNARLSQLTTESVTIGHQMVADKLNKENANKSLEKLNKQLEFISTTDICPVCASKLTEKHRNQEKQKLLLQIESEKGTVEFSDISLNENLKKKVSLDETITSIKQKMTEEQSEYNRAMVNRTNSENQKRILESEIEGFKSAIVAAKSRLEEAKQETFDNIYKNLVGQEKIDEYKSKFESLKTELTECVNSTKYYELIKKLLSDSGIKSNVINRDIPFINASINAYLKQFERNYVVEFDSEFNINIRGYAKNGLSYYNLSEGEKKRIDLAILLSFIDLSKKKNSIDINILVFDEIFDTSLDQVGQSAFIQMLDKKIKDGVIQNVFIISHDRNLVLPQAEVISVIKEAEFSRISLT